MPSSLLLVHDVFGVLRYLKHCPNADCIADLRVMLMVQLLCLTSDMFDLRPF